MFRKFKYVLDHLLRPRAGGRRGHKTPTRGTKSNLPPGRSKRRFL